MKVLITGSGGLIGSEAAFYFLKNKNNQVIGIDNNMRMSFFGKGGDITNVIMKLSSNKNYSHYTCDITNREKICGIIKSNRPDVIIHTAAQPSHDKAASIPFIDFDINAVGTVNLLEATRLHCKSSIFIHMSTNKVYGDAPNKINLVENESRYDFDQDKIDNFLGVSEKGISEKFTIDNSTHSLFGASKLAADIVAQEYGRYFGMNIGVFRGGCLTGPQHAGVELHGFLSYIIKCAIKKKQYTVFGYKGKQVRDQIHSSDVISAFASFINEPRQGEVYNIGGCKQNSASILEVIDMIRETSSRELLFDYLDSPRTGDHICYYSDMSKFKLHYPNWNLKYSLNDIILEIINMELKN